ncbi:Hypothetical_protein [Hexamita inflata]|uniref:Hypothetical_protein n=1 Tax=Hexamita inflata TaxID=28002 RepID=A0AA86PDZ3_9EUKA|nr:Hypothetical protein HINF_LOCUS25025 [Hexamita inflata]
MHICTTCVPAAKATNDSGTNIYGRNAAASCKPIYTGIHLGRTICVSKETMERLLLSNPDGLFMACPWPYRSLTAAQHFESGIQPSTTDLAASQNVGCGEERQERSNEPIIDHIKQSWYFSSASSSPTSTIEPDRSYYLYVMWWSLIWQNIGISKYLIYLLRLLPM